MKKPRILLNMAVGKRSSDGRLYSYTLEDYSAGISSSGALPFLVPPVCTVPEMEEMLDLADGVLLIGGEDYDPAFYGEKPQIETAMTRLRGEFDLAFCKAVLARKIPVLGICAGCQLLNIASGGKLIQHIPGHRGITHDAVVCTEGSASRALGRKKGESFPVCSFHHQAVDPLHVGNGFVIAARAHDSSVEIIERAGGFALGLQFHPERMGEKGKVFFDLLKKEAEKYRDPYRESTSSSKRIMQPS